MRLQESLLVTIKPSDDGLDRYGSQLLALADGQAARVLSDGLNKAGNLARTQVKRALVTQSGVKYRLIDQSTQTTLSTPSTLTYSLAVSGEETNLNLFGARQTSKGVSAAPWGRRQIFDGAFIVEAWGGKVMRRASASRFPVASLWGPNLAREVLKERPLAAFETTLNERWAGQVARQLARHLGK
jgi:hypothetical protein